MQTRRPDPDAAVRRPHRRHLPSARPVPEGVCRNRPADSPRPASRSWSVVCRLRSIGTRRSSIEPLGWPSPSGKPVVERRVARARLSPSCSGLTSGRRRTSILISVARPSTSQPEGCLNRRPAMHEPANRLVHTLVGVANDIGRVVAARSPRRRPESTSLATRACARMARRPEPAPPLTDRGHPRRAAPPNRDAARATEPIPKDRPVSSRSARPTPKRRTNQSHRTAWTCRSELAHRSRRSH